MNKRKLTALMAVLVMSAMAACGNTKEASNMNEVEAENMESSTDILVSTLEYMLNEDKVPNEAEDNTEQAEEEETQAKIEATIYYGNGASDKLNTEVSTMEELTAENLISALSGHNIVSLGTKVNSFEEEEGTRGKALHLDLDKAFREYLKTMNKESEKIILASVTATFLEAYDAESITITVDGKVLETNHDTYEEPFKYAREYIKSPSESN
ncbi:MAG: GerMN domain-containing protein [Lachnospiraceae bacterium]|nr:GerMN domain-containing protein [Lachnospiraceae bacterium]